MFVLLPTLSSQHDRAGASIPHQGSRSSDSGVHLIVHCEIGFHYYTVEFPHMAHMEVTVSIVDLALQEPLLDGSREMRAIQSVVASVADTDATVLIRGESGVGKDVIARTIHAASARRDYAFVKVNCAAIPTGLLESEFFGHERGAFTGAIDRRIGRFELAHQGTIFLDEVEDIPLELQSKLLRVLQEQEFERLGSSRTLRVSVRVVAATNSDLAELVAEKKFRNDLYYRLNVFPINVPPLRERSEDIPMLV